MKKQNKVYNETFNVEFDDFKVSIKKHWSFTQINALITEFIDQLDKQIRSENPAPLSEGYLYLLYLKHFSSLAIPNEFDKQIEWLEELLDTGYFEYLVTKLPKDQIEAVEKELQKALDTLNDRLPKIKKELDKYEFENDEVEEMVKGKAE